MVIFPLTELRYSVSGGPLSHIVVNGGAHVLRDDGAHGGGAAPAARPARRRRERADQEAEEEELVAGESRTLSICTVRPICL